MRAQGQGQWGVTLLELLVVLALFGIIVAGIMVTWQKTQESYFVGSEAADIQGNLRVALDQMAHEIRRAVRDPTGCAFDFDSLDNCSTAKRDACRTKLGNSTFDCANVFAIPEATTTSLRIRQDLNSNGFVTPASTNPNEDVTFTFNSANSRITRNGQSLAEKIIANPDGTPIFQYWRNSVVNGVCNGSTFETFTPASQTDRDCIRRVTITLTAQTTLGGATLTKTARTDVDLRTR